MLAAHPDYVTVMDSADFSTFVNGDALAKATLEQVSQSQDIGLAIELVSRFKNSRKQDTTEVRQEAIKQASSGSVQASSEKVAGKKVLASELRKLYNSDKKRYDALVSSGALGKLFKEGRVIKD